MSIDKKQTAKLVENDAQLKSTNECPVLTRYYKLLYTIPLMVTECMSAFFMMAKCVLDAVKKFAKNHATNLSITNS